MAALRLERRRRARVWDGVNAASGAPFYGGAMRGGTTTWSHGGGGRGSRGGGVRLRHDRDEDGADEWGPPVSYTSGERRSAGAIGPVRTGRELEELGLGLPWAYKEVKEG